MSAPPRVTATGPSNSDPSEDGPTRPAPTAIQPQEDSVLRPEDRMGHSTTKKKRNHRGGKKKRTRRQSFALPADNGSGMQESSRGHRGDDDEQNAARASFYRLHATNTSNTSLESEALLDHR
jgi:magnesium transporter